MQLLDNEKVLKRQDKIGYGSALNGSKSELILTNQRLILEQKNLFGKPKGTLYFNLADIRVADGQAQVVVGKKDNLTHTLDVYFKSSEERFVFEWEKDIKSWVRAISAVIAGEEVKDNDEEEWMMEALHMADAFTGTIDKYKEVFGLKEKENVTVKCTSCGAALNGLKGSTIECPYCKTYVKL